MSESFIKFDTDFLFVKIMLGIKATKTVGENTGVKEQKEWSFKAAMLFEFWRFNFVHDMTETIIAYIANPYD